MSERHLTAAILLTPTPRGFRVEGRDGAIVATRDATGLTLSGPLDEHGSRVEICDRRCRLVGGAGIAVEAFRPLEAGNGLDGAWLLTREARLLRSRQWGVREPRVELIDWETEGPFLNAVPYAEGWRLEWTSAGASHSERKALLLGWATLIWLAETPV